MRHQWDKPADSFERKCRRCPAVIRKYVGQGGYQYWPQGLHPAAGERQDPQWLQTIPECEPPAAATLWLHDDPRNGYHDSRCQCPGHCGNCFEDLASIRALHERLIADGSPAAPDVPLHPDARYCSAWCRGRAKRERALDRQLAAVTPRA